MFYPKTSPTMTEIDKEVADVVKFVCASYIKGSGQCKRGDACPRLHPTVIEAYVELRDRQIAEGNAKAQLRSCYHGDSCTRFKRNSCIFHHQKDVGDLSKEEQAQKNRIGSTTQQAVTPNADISSGSSGTSEVVEVCSYALQGIVRTLASRNHLPNQEQIDSVAEETSQLTLEAREALDRERLVWKKLADSTVLPELIASDFSIDNQFTRPTVFDIINLVADKDVSASRMEQVHSLHKTTYVDALNNGFEGWPMPFYAIKHGREDLLAHFLRSGSSPDMTGGPGLPLVIFALINDYHDESTSTVRLILSLHAKPEVLPSSLFSPYVVPAGLAPNVDVATLPAWFAGARERWEKKLKDKEKFYILGQYYFDVAATTVVPPRVQQVSPLIGQAALYGAAFLVIGQKIATEGLRNAFLAHATGVDRHLPLVLLLAGPSGHGKTQLATNLARMIEFEQSFISMTEMREVSDLFGGKHVAGSDGSKIARSGLEKFLVEHTGKKGAVILDQLEKTPFKAVLDSLLSIWESGHYVSRRTEAQIDCSQIIWICTTNAADPYIYEFCLTGEYKTAFETGVISRSIVEELERGTIRYLKQSFSKPILGRIHQVIPFVPFSVDERAVVVSELALRTKRHLAKPIALEGPVVNAFGGSKLHYIEQEVAICREVAEDYDPDEGARSLIKATRKQLEDKVAKTYFANTDLITEGSTQNYEVKHTQKTGIRVFFVELGEEAEKEEDGEE